MLLIPKIVIRAAVETDAPAMMALIRELAVFEEEPDAVTVTLEHFIDCGFGEQPVWWAFNAFDGEQLVGMALYYIRYSTWKGRTMYLEDIIVTAAWRGRGLGAMLMEQLQQEARRRKLSAISWQVLDWNQDAIKFYEKYKVTMDSHWINVRMEC